MAGLIRYGSEDKVIDTQKVVTSTWSSNTNDASNFINFTSSIATGTDSTSSGAFYIQVYNNAGESQSQYFIAYGHKHGSGSLDFTNDDGAIGRSATRLIYNQYRQLVYGDETTDFNFEGHTPDDIFVININRARYKHNLKAGSLNLFLSGSTAGAALGTIHLTISGANDLAGTLIHNLTDDSITVTGSATITNAGRQFNLVSGSSGVRSGSTTVQTPSGSYGFFYPDAGFIIVNGGVMKNANGYVSRSLGSAGAGHVVNNSHEAFRRAISSSNGGQFIVDSEEKITSQYFFTRVKNNEFNYTTNPSFIDTNGNLNFTSMVDNPKTFITTIGLYNDSNDLVAVAKVSQPISKDFSKEALMRVKLDY